MHMLEYLDTGGWGPFGRLPTPAAPIRKVPSTRRLRQCPQTPSQKESEAGRCMNVYVFTHLYVDIHIDIEETQKRHRRDTEET